MPSSRKSPSASMTDAVKYDFGELDEVSLAYAIRSTSRRDRSSRPW